MLHDLEHVLIDIDYVDLTDVGCTYTGLESAFDWKEVRQVSRVERLAARRDEVDWNRFWAEFDWETLDWETLDWGTLDWGGDLGGWGDLGGGQ